MNTTTCYKSITLNYACRIQQNHIEINAARADANEFFMGVREVHSIVGIANMWRDISELFAAFFILCVFNSEGECGLQIRERSKSI